MGSKLGLSRSELIFCVALLLAAIVFGVVRLSEAIYKIHEPEIFEDAMQSVDPGETLYLAHREVGRQDNFIPWDGTIAMTITDAAVYSSYRDALEAGEPVDVTLPTLRDEGAPFLVMVVDVTNIDAIDKETGKNSSSAHQDTESIDDVVTLGQFFELSSDAEPLSTGSLLVPCVWRVDDTAATYYNDTVEVIQGQSAHVVLGFSLEGGKETRLGGMSLTYRSPFDRMNVGVPTIVDGTGEAPEQWDT